MRRLRTEPVGILVTLEKGSGIEDPLGVWRALPATSVRHVRLGPLRGDALRLLLRSKLGPDAPTTALAEIERLSAGNPTIALELADAGPFGGAPGEPVRVPDRRRDAVHDVLDRLPPAAAALLVVAEQAPGPASIATVEAATGPDAGRALRDAAGAGLVALDGDAIRFTHPWIGPVIALDAGPEERWPRASPTAKSPKRCS